MSSHPTGAEFSFYKMGRFQRSAVHPRQRATPGCRVLANLLKGDLMSGVLTIKTTVTMMTTLPREFWCTVVVQDIYPLRSYNEGRLSLIFFFKLMYSWFQRRQWHPTPVLLPGKSHGWRSLVGSSPRGRKESDTTSLSQLVSNVVPICYAAE